MGYTTQKLMLELSREAAAVASEMRRIEAEMLYARYVGGNGELDVTLSFHALEICLRNAGQALVALKAHLREPGGDS